MAETENAAKRTREAPKGPVKPEPAPAEAEQESEARARQLVGLLQAESAAAPPPDESNGNGHVAGLQRDAQDRNGNGHRAVRPADLHALQRLAGNAAVVDLVAPPARPKVQRAAIDTAHPERTTPEIPAERTKLTTSAERKAARKEVSEAIKEWFAAPPPVAGTQGAAGQEVDDEAAAPEDTGGAGGGLTQPDDAGGPDTAAATAAAGPEATAGPDEPGGGSTAGGEGPQASEASPAVGAESGGGGAVAQAGQLGLGPAALAGGAAAASGAALAGGAAAASGAALAGTVAMAGAEAAIAGGGMAADETAAADTATDGADGAVPDEPQGSNRAPARELEPPSARPEAASVPRTRSTRPAMAAPPSPAPVASPSRRTPGADGNAGAAAVAASHGSAEDGREAGPSGASAVSATSPSTAPVTAPEHFEGEPVATPPTISTAADDASSSAPASPTALTTGNERAPEAAAARTTSSSSRTRERDDGAAGDRAPRTAEAGLTATTGATTSRPNVSAAGSTSAPPTPAVAATPIAASSAVPTMAVPTGGGDAGAQAEAAAQVASARVAGRADRAAVEDEALERQATEGIAQADRAASQRADSDEQTPSEGGTGIEEGEGAEQEVVRESLDDGGAGQLTTLARSGPAAAAVAPGHATQAAAAPRRRGGGGGSRKGKEALTAWQGAAGGAVGGVKPPDMSATEGAKDAVATGAKTISTTRESNKPDYKAEAKKVVPPTPEPPEREKMMDFTAPRGAIDSIRKVGETKLQSRTLRAAGAPPPLPSYITPEHFVPPDLTAALAEAERLAAEATGAEKIELDKKASALRAKIQGLKEAEGVAAGGDEIAIEGEGAAKAEPPESAEDRAVVAAALSELAAQQDDVVDQVVKQARKKVDPGKLSDKAQEAIGAHRGAVASELTTELQGIASAAGIVDKDLDAKIVAGKAKAKAEGESAKKATDTAAEEGKEELKAQGKKETGEQKQASAAVKEDAEAKVKAIEGGPEPEDIEAKVTEYLDKTITTGNKAKAAIASAVKKMTTKLDDKATAKRKYFSATGMKRSDAVRRYWRAELKDDEDPRAGQKKGEEEAVPTMAWLRQGKKGTDTEVGLIKNEVNAEQKALDALVDSTVDTARDTIRDWGAEQEGTTRSWWEELWDDFMDWWDDVGTAADGWEEQQNAETRDTIITDAKAIDAIVTAKKEDIDKVKDEQLEGMDSERRAIIEQYLAMGGSNSIQLVVALTKHDITKRRIGQAVSDVDEQIMSWSWTEIDAICRSRNKAWPGADVLAGKILSGTGTTKVRKEKIFEGLAGAKTPLERKALEGAFAALAPEGSEKDLDEVLEDRLSFDDEDRAQALRAGKTDEADAAAIEAALSLTSDNIAPDTESITKVLRGKSPAEIDAIKRAYKEKYGDDLDEVLGDTWFYDSEESDMVVALAKGDTDLADAAEVHDALKNWGTDEDQYNKVFDNIRSEVQAQALKEGMSPAEVEYEIKRRTQAVSDAYEQKYGTPLKTAVDEEFDGTEQKLAEAYLSGDADRIDATKVLDERYSFNSDDDALEATVRNQKARAEEYYKQHYASMEAQLQERLEAGLISQQQYLDQVRLVREDRKANEKQLVDDMTVENTKKLRSTYGDVSGGRDLDTDIKAVTQGASHAEISYLLETNGVLTDAEELHFALAGAGTDEAMVKKLLYGRTPEEIAKLKREYEAIHGTGSFDRDIRSEMDWGRDDEQILLMLEHDTSTPEGKLAYLKAASELERSGLLYDEEDDPIGTDKSIALLEKQLEEYNRIKDDPDATDAQKAAAKTLLDMRLSGSEAQLKEFGDLKDAEIDEWVDKVKYGLIAVNPGFAFLLLDDALLASPMRLALGGATEDAGQLAVQWAISVIDMALMVATVVSGGSAAPATVPLLTLLKQGAYKEVAKRVIMELGQQALESIVMAAMETALSEKAWDSHDSVDVFAEQALTDFVAGLVLSGAIDVASGAMSKFRIDADGRIVPDDAGAKVDADGGKVDADDPRTRPDDAGGATLPDVDDAGAPKTGDGGGTGRTDVDDTGAGRADDGGGAGTKADDGGGAGKKTDIDDGGGTGTKTKGGDGGGGTPKADDAGGGGKKGGADDGGGGTGDGPGKIDPEAEIAAKAGMDVKTVDFLKDFADNLGLRLQFRPTTKAAPGQIAGGAKAKVEIAKMKTANSADRLLTDALDLDGADFGKVVLFEPLHPSFRPKNDPRYQAWVDLDVDGRKAVNDRYAQRLKEWNDLHPGTNPYFKEGSGLDGDPALRMDGPFVQVQGLEGGYSGMTGDHDLFDVSWANGKPMTREEYDAIIASLRHSGVNVEHGAHITWPRDRPKDFNPAAPPAGVGPEQALKNRQAYEKIIDDHASGKEPLVEIGPGGVRETTPDLFMPEWDAEGTVTPGFSVPDTPVPGSGKAGGDTGGSGSTKAGDAGGDGDVDVDSGEWDRFVEDLHEQIEADATPHPAHQAEIESIAPEDVFAAARADAGTLSAKAQAEHAAAVNPPASSIQTPSSPINRTAANKVAADDITDVGSMGSGQGSLGVFHHDFDGTPGVMKVFSATDSTHMRNFAWELSAARAAHDTGYVRFLGEFDASRATGSNLVPARAIGYEWQPGKSLDKLDEIGGESRIKPHTVDQVKDFARQMAERGYVLGGDFQYLVDINGNVRPMDLEAFQPLPPPGPARDAKLADAQKRLEQEIDRLQDMIETAQKSDGSVGSPVPDDTTKPDIEVPDGMPGNTGPPAGTASSAADADVEPDTKPDIQVPGSQTGAPATTPSPGPGVEQGSYRMLDDVPKAGSGEASVILVDTDVDVPGPGTLTAQELADLQAIADKHGAAIAVIGSRGRGEGRNIGTDLPHGKGPGTRSDIDVLIEGQNDIDSRGQLSDDIRNLGDGVANIASSTGYIGYPAIVIRPRS